jgi:hypothetical protein
MNARALTRDFPPILARLIPRLASPFDAEVISTVRAIQRALEAQKLDLHDLAAVVAGAPVPCGSSYAWSPPHRAESQESAEIRAWLTAVANEDWINDWTAGFIENILSRQSLDRLTKKQVAVINNIITEAHRRGVRPARRAA